jgi:hypothetical protein
VRQAPPAPCQGARAPVAAPHLRRREARRLCQRGVVVQPQVLAQPQQHVGGRADGRDAARVGRARLLACGGGGACRGRRGGGLLCSRSRGAQAPSQAAPARIALASRTSSPTPSHPSLCAPPILRAGRDVAELKCTESIVSPPSTASGDAGPAGAPASSSCLLPPSGAAAACSASTCATRASIFLRSSRCHPRASRRSPPAAPAAGAAPAAAGSLVASPGAPPSSPSSSSSWAPKPAVSSCSRSS